jgi:hypothetical protein
MSVEQLPSPTKGNGAASRKRPKRIRAKKPKLSLTVALEDLNRLETKLEHIRHSIFCDAIARPYAFSPACAEIGIDVWRAWKITQRLLSGE